MIITDEMLVNQSKGIFSTRREYGDVFLFAHDKPIARLRATTALLGETSNHISIEDPSGIGIQVNVPTTTDLEVIGFRILDYYKKQGKNRN